MTYKYFFYSSHIRRYDYYFYDTSDQEITMTEELNIAICGHITMIIVYCREVK